MESTPSSRPTSSFTWLVLLGIVVNVVLAALYHLTTLEVFSTLQNVLAAGLVGALSLILLRFHKITALDATVAAVPIVVLAVHLIVNYDILDYSDLVKFASVFVFYTCGANLGIQYGRVERSALYFLLVLPLAVEVGGGSRVYSAPDSFSIFQNFNTAILYYMAILFAILPVFGRWSIIIHLAIVIFFQKIGILVATIVGLAMPLVTRLRARSFAGLILLGLAVGVGYLLGLLERPIAVVTTMITDLSSLGLDGISQLSFAGLSQRTNSTDLSGYFRLLHWTEILNLMGQGNALQVLFGVGGGVSQKVTSMRLVPHNDYLKIAFEYGVLMWIFFVAFLIRVYSGLASKEAKGLFLVLCIYFFSENVLNNFASMALFFFFAGLFSRVASSESSASESRNDACAPIQVRR